MEAAAALAPAAAAAGAAPRRWIATVAPGYSAALQVLGRWAFGWGLAAVVGAMLLGALRPLAWVLSAGAFVPVAALSYSCYILQVGHAIPSDGPYVLMAAKTGRPAH